MACIKTLVSKVEASGASLKLTGGVLCLADGKRLSSALLAELKANREAIVSYLSTPPPCSAVVPFVSSTLRLVWVGRGWVGPDLSVLWVYLANDPNDQRPVYRLTPQVLQWMVDAFETAKPKLTEEQKVEALAAISEASDWVLKHHWPHEFPPRVKLKTLPSPGVKPPPLHGV